MPIEALLWSLLLIFGPAMARRFWPSLRERFVWLPVDLERMAPWIHGLGIPYLAFMLGSVSSRRAGLHGFPSATWLSGGLACALAVGAAYFLLGRFSTQPDPEQKIEMILLEEARWAFYRAVAVFWVASPFSAFLGLGLATLEWGITRIAAQPRRRPSPAHWKGLMRAVFSTLLFVLTGNFWLTAGTQMILTLLISKQAEAARVDTPTP